jgi:hypothetical protein
MEILEGGVRRKLFPSNCTAGFEILSIEKGQNACSGMEVAVISPTDTSERKR